MTEDAPVLIGASFPMPSIFLKEEEQRIGEMVPIDVVLRNSKVSAPS